MHYMVSDKPDGFWQYPRDQIGSHERRIPEDDFNTESKRQS
jgi:hypothetical protein